MRALREETRRRAASSSCTSCSNSSEMVRKEGRLEGFWVQQRLAKAAVHSRTKVGACTSHMRQ